MAWVTPSFAEAPGGLAQGPRAPGQITPDFPVITKGNFPIRPTKSRSGGFRGPRSPLRREEIPVPIAFEIRRVLRSPAPALASLALLGLAAPSAALAQFPGAIGDTVTWTLSAPTPDAVKAGGRASLQLRGAVKPGWHVYGLKQSPEGPTPLEISVENPAIASAAGTPTGAAPIKKHDPSFDLETQYYERDFTLSVPVKIAAKAAAGRQVVPVSVHYQTCDGRICQPPKTVRLSAAVNVQPGR
jgi:thiol:disulfide interchange protein DsbD